ncbi:hypothetical protein SBA6_70009 [Candidatus Sulfopaludibacter sp. SbA6]|nr:hypothetical protein SBA6_70009 [Candidatus Sulfopaludibacter sp. SbA6]
MHIARRGTVRDAWKTELEGRLVDFVHAR